MGVFDDVDKTLDLDQNKVLSSALTSAEKQARSVLAVENIKAKWHVIFGTIIMPVCWSGFFSSISPKDQTFIFIGLGLLLGIVSTYFIFKIFAMQAPQNAHFVFNDLYRTATNLRSYSAKVTEQNKEMRKKIERLDTSVEALSQSLAESMRELNTTLSCQAPENHEQFNMHLEKILEPFVTDFSALYGLPGNKVMFTLYLWDSRIEKLNISFRRKRGDIHEYKRAWERRQGFAGIVFAEKKASLENDIQVDGSNPRFKMHSKDKETYRAAIGVPIIKAGDEYQTKEDPLGVLVLTSNVAGAFDDRTGEYNRYGFILDAVTQVVAIYLDYVGSSLDDNDYPKVIFGG